MMSLCLPLSKSVFSHTVAYSSKHGRGECEFKQMTGELTQQKSLSSVPKPADNIQSQIQYVLQRKT